MPTGTGFKVITFHAFKLFLVFFTVETQLQNV